MNPNRRPTSRAAAMSVALLFIVLTLTSAGCAAEPAAPTVDELVETFRAHRSDFQRLEPLASIDATFGIEVDEDGLDGRGIKTKRIEDYAEPLAAIGAQHVDVSDHTIDVTVGEQGMAVSGSMWGYYYTTEADMETVTLDVAAGGDSPDLWFYALGDGWYASVYRF